jgi:PKD repeat protein
MPIKSFLIIPVGEVMKRLNDKMIAGQVPGYSHIWQWYIDGIHLTNIGSYMKACTFFATLYGQDPRGLGVPPKYYGIAPAIVSIIQETVWEVVTTYPYSGVTASIPVTGVNIIPNTITTQVGQQVNINAEILPNNATNTGWQWTSSNPTVATVNNSGVLTALGQGTTTIIVETDDGNFQDNVPITVNAGASVGVASVSLSPTNQTLNVGSVLQLTADVLPLNATNKAVTFSSDNTAAATVDANGLVATINVGTANITVTTVDGNKTATSVITVVPNSPPVATINASLISGFAPLTVNFDAIGSYDPDPNDYVLGYDWNFGGSEGISISNAPTHTYTQAGQYNVTLRVMDNKNLYGSPAIQTINVIPLVRNVTAQNESANGNYYDINIEAGGALFLSGNLNIQGTLRVKSGGSILFNGFTLVGTGNFILESGALIYIYKPEGINTSTIGDVQVTGTKTFASDAIYYYQGTTAQQTGDALPNTILNLFIDNPQNVTLTNPLSVKNLLSLENGNLISNGKLTLLSTATQTAILIQKQDGSNQVVGNVTVQRHITGHSTGFQGIGYHYFSSPVQNAKVSDFADDMPLVLNPNYDFVSPYSGTFPNFFRYKESRVQTNAPDNIFEKGWESPANQNEDLLPM